MEDQGIARIKEIKKYLNLNSGEKKLSSLHFKPIRLSKSPLEKKILALYKKNLSHPLNEKIQLRNELRNILLNAEELKSLPQHILQIHLFSQFECCHILVHEKGKPLGQNFFFRFSDENPIKSITVQSFNNIFALVKKSKNKIFNQSESLKEDLGLVGNFLAKEIDLKNHSVILLISRNSFLPPSLEEQEHFFSLCNFLNPIFGRLLDREKNDLKKDVIIKSLKKFPEKIFVKDHNRIIFSNDRSDTALEDLNLMSFPLGGNDGLTMELSNISKDNISTEIYHSQRISLLGELLNTLQHELSNPLFGLNLTSSLLMSESNNPEVLETLNDICQNAIRSQTIIKNFSNLYNDQQEHKIFNLVTLVEETMTLTKSESKEIPKFIICDNFDKSEGFPINTNPTYLTQIIFNLIINAAQAIKSNSTTPHYHSIKIHLMSYAENVTINVVDDGPGVKKDLSTDIFKPFFTTKDSGTGLGLSICKNLANQLGAELNFSNNSPLPGATFSINLPK